MEREFLRKVIDLTRATFAEALDVEPGSASDFSELVNSLRGCALALQGCAEATGFDTALDASFEELDTALQVCSEPGELLQTSKTFAEMLAILGGATQVSEELADESDDEELADEDVFGDEPDQPEEPAEAIEA